MDIFRFGLSTVRYFETWKHLCMLSERTRRKPPPSSFPLPLSVLRLLTLLPTLSVILAILIYYSPRTKWNETYWETISGFFGESSKRTSCYVFFCSVGSTGFLVYALLRPPDPSSSACGSVVWFLTVLFSLSAAVGLLGQAAWLSDKNPVLRIHIGFAVAFFLSSFGVVSLGIIADLIRLQIAHGRCCCCCPDRVPRIVPGSSFEDREQTPISEVAKKSSWCSCLLFARFIVLLARIAVFFLLSSIIIVTVVLRQSTDGRIVTPGEIGWIGCCILYLGICVLDELVCFCATLLCCAPKIAKPLVAEDLMSAISDDTEDISEYGSVTIT